MYPINLKRKSEDYLFHDQYFLKKRMLNKLNPRYINYNTHEQIMFNPRINSYFVSLEKSSSVTDEYSHMIIQKYAKMPLDKIYYTK